MGAGKKRKTGREILDMIETLKQEIPLGSVRYHYKNDAHHYQIKDIVFDSTTHELMLIYKALYVPEDILFSRLATAFLETVYHLEKNVTRFTRIS